MILAQSLQRFCEGLVLLDASEVSLISPNSPQIPLRKESTKFLTYKTARNSPLESERSTHSPFGELARRSYQRKEQRLNKSIKQRTTRNVIK